jgi:hypothetical protein
MNYNKIKPEIEAICAENPKCYLPDQEIKCPYSDVCFADYEGLDNGKAALETAIVAKYMELNGIDSKVKQNNTN